MALLPSCTETRNKKHETVKVFCKPCKPGQGHEYAQELARLSGGIPLQIIGDDTIIFDCGKNYEQPEVMSPIDTLSKNKVYLCFMKKEKKRSEMHDCYSFCSSFKSIGNANCFDVLPALSVAEKVHVMQVFCKMRQEYAGVTSLSMKLTVPTNLLRNFGMVKSEQSAL
ncbi:hypothetical protein JHK85_006784 [Glycine max]|nr:hypothetical protein JHK85_006784 [Glycine max]